MSLLMIPFLFTLMYQSIRQIRSSSTFLKIGDFGFEKNSTFNLIFTEIESNNLIYCLFSEDEFYMYPLNQFPILEICQNDSKFPSLRFEIPNNISEYHGTIKESGIYYQVIVNCEDEDILPTQTVLTVNQVFHNPSTNLDIRWKGIKKSKTIVVITFSSLLFLWFVNMLFQSSYLSKIHLALSITFIFNLVADILRIFEMTRLDKNDHDGGFTISRVSLGVLHKFSLFMTLLLICKGWCVTRNIIPFGEVVLFYILLLFFIVLSIIYEFIDLKNYELVILMVMMVIAVMYIREMTMSIHETRQYLLAKLITIMNSAEFKNTLLYRMRRVYAWLEGTILFCSALHVALVVTSIFVHIPFWLAETLRDSILTFFLTILIVLFGMKRGDISSGYASVAAAFPLTDLESLRGNETNLQNGGDQNKFEINTSHDAIEDESINPNADVC
ncbi:hypothetical protein TRFO_42851 [Tritrichomonas foetus]|uniref:Intimal thickness related receptor IRP domain-containing protein n=1 Tax=Tritrichomonas foetus TaxID=1144522 RepID=A0A1J4KVF2_9EUKA|nr:hypothetical protein TRFO_42851 [Tritrichomonas foetus]|eukprot:OHT14872.1 hypothetical protein TRFO_42851 [Tritrichomonas foetus]